MKLYGFSRSKLFIRFLLYYLLLIIIPFIVIGSLSYSSSLNYINKKDREFYDDLMSKTSDSIITKLNHINDMSSFLLRNGRLQGLLYNYDKSNVDELRSKLEFFYAASELRQTCYTDRYLEEIAFYIKSNDCIVHTLGIDKSSYFLDIMYSRNQATLCNILKGYDIWNNLYYTPPTTLFIKNKSTKVLSFIKTISNDPKNSDGAIMLYINPAMFDDILNPSDLNNHLLVSIIDRNNQAILGNVLGHGFITDYSYYDGKVKKARANDSEYTVYSTDINTLPWRLAVYVPVDSTAFFKIYSPSFITIIIIFAVAGIILSFYLTYRSCKPIMKITDSLAEMSKRSSAQIDLTIDDYYFIEKNLLKINQDLKKLENSSEPYHKMLEYCLMSKLLTENPVNSRDIKNIADTIGLADIETKYLIAVFDMYYPSSDGKCKSVEFSGIDEFYKTVEKEMGSIGVKSYIYKFGSAKNILLFEWPDSRVRDGQPAIPKDTVSALLEVQSTFMQENPAQITLGIGAITNTLYNLGQSYKNACYALSYGTLNGLSSCMEYEEIANIAVQPFYYPLEFETDILNALKTGNIQKIKTILSTILEENLNNRKLDLFSLKCLYYELYATHLKSLSKFDYASYNRIPNPDETARTINGMAEFLEESFIKACNGIKGSDGNTIKNSILELVDKDLYNPVMSLEYLAKNLKISPFFISRFFNKEMNTSFHDYINKKRVSLAINLLRKSEFSLDEIRLMCGFSSKTTLIRVFKRYEGITPDQFKQLNSLATS